MENSQIQTDLDESLAINEKRIFSSTLIEDNCDLSVIEVKKEISVIELLEETATSFVCEDSGVIHIKTEKISKIAPKGIAPAGDVVDGTTLDNGAGVDNGETSKGLLKRSGQNWAKV